MRKQSCIESTLGLEAAPPRRAAPTHTSPWCAAWRDSATSGTPAGTPKCCTIGSVSCTTQSSGQRSQNPATTASPHCGFAWPNCWKHRGPWSVSPVKCIAGSSCSENGVTGRWGGVQCNRWRFFGFRRRRNPSNSRRKRWIRWPQSSAFQTDSFSREPSSAGWVCPPRSIERGASNTRGGIFV
ncbi:MAG: hypothetical protein RLZZ399_2712 [Verrucomicrobiota bacterium]